METSKTSRYKDAKRNHADEVFILVLIFPISILGCDYFSRCSCRELFIMSMLRLL